MNASISAILSLPYGLASQLTLMAAILKKAAIRFELKGRPGGWHDPFEGLKIAASIPAGLSDLIRLQ